MRLFADRTGGMYAGSFEKDTTATRVERGVTIAAPIRFARMPQRGWTLHERMQQAGASALSIAIVDHGRVHSETFGTLSAGEATPVTPLTRFQAASASKAVTAMAALVLVEQGRLWLDAPINDALVHWKLPESAFTRGHPVTLRALLSHTAGVNVPSFPGFERGARPPTLRQILDGDAYAGSDSVRVTFPQGHHRYSGGGLMVVQQAIEEASGETLASYAAHAVFVPAGMQHSGYTAPPSGQVALGHDRSGKPLVSGWHDYPQLAATGLWSTPTDLARLLADVHAAWIGEHGHLLSPKMVRTLAQPVVAGMGLGLGSDGQGRSLRISHSGSTKGYRTHVVLFPRSGDGVVVMANGDGADDLVAEVVRTIAAERGWPPGFAPETVEVARWPGQQIAELTTRSRFREAGFAVEVTHSGGLFSIATPSGASFQMVPVGESTLRLLASGETVSVEDGRLHLWGMTAEPIDPRPE